MLVYAPRGGGGIQPWDVQYCTVHTDSTYIRYIHAPLAGEGYLANVGFLSLDQSSIDCPEIRMSRFHKTIPSPELYHACER